MDIYKKRPLTVPLRRRNLISYTFSKCSDFPSSGNRCMFNHMKRPAPINVQQNQRHLCVQLKETEVYGVIPGQRR